MKWIALALLTACATTGGSQRYVMMEDLGSRYHFRYVFDTTTKRWANRECELRVDAARELSPDLSVQLFRPGTVESALHPTRRRPRVANHARDGSQRSGGPRRVRRSDRVAA